LNDTAAAGIEFMNVTNQREGHGDYFKATADPDCMDFEA
jgi:hypothetical protein